MNVFERHNITHLSASSINLYVGQPAKWCLRYLYGIKDEMGPAIWRGWGVEAGLDWWLFRRNEQDAEIEALTKAHARFEEEAKGEIRDDIDKERDAIEPMLHRAIESLSAYPTPDARQLQIDFWIDGIEVPLDLRLDYVFADCVLDLKTTRRLEMREEHARQVALYAKAKSKSGKLLYVTTKRSELIELTPDQVDYHFRRLCRAAHSIRALLSLCPDKETAAGALPPPDFDHPYYWKNEALKTAAMEIWT